MFRGAPFFKTVTLHIGPTNSGKTYAALQALREAKSGLYAAPLRLLAHEVYECLRSSGIRVSLLTGQQQIIDEDATHVACTVEMAPNRVFDVGVVDEIQMVRESSPLPPPLTASHFKRSLLLIVGLHGPMRCLPPAVKVCIYVVQLMRGLLLSASQRIMQS